MVLVVGRTSGGGIALPSAEIYDSSGRH